MKLLTQATAAIVVFIATTAAVARAADEKVTFDDNVVAVLRQRCGGCHNPDKKSGDLDVTSYTAVMQGGGSGGAVEPGDASASYLYKLITHQDEPKMPPDSPPIPEDERALIKKWIDGGVLENKGSKAAAPKKVVAMAMDAAPTERPAVTPLPARIPLEPVIRTKGIDACASIATSPWAPLAAVCGQRQVLLYRTDTRQLAGVLPFPEGRPQVLQFSRNGGLLVGGGGRGGASGRVVVWSIDNGRRVRELGNELDTVLAADVSADQRFVALGGPQRVVRIYSTETGELLHELRKHTDWIMAASFSPDGVLLATSDRNGGVLVWEAATGRDFLSLTGHTAAVTSLSWRSDSNLLATASEDGTIRLWEMENGSQMKSWPAHAGGVAALEFTRDGRLVSVGRDKTPRIWDQGGNQQKAFEPCADLAVAVSYCDETDAVIVGDWTGEIRLWKGAEAVRIGGLSSNPETLAERTAAAERAIAERAPAAETARTAAETAIAQMAAMQKQIDETTQAKTEAEGQLADWKTQLEAASRRRTEAAAALATAQQAVAAADRGLAAAIEAHSRAFATLAQNPADLAGRTAALDLAAAMQAQRMAAEARREELAAFTEAVTAADSQTAMLTTRRDQSQAAVDAALATLATLGPALEPLEQATTTAAAKATELAALLEAARADQARWQDETAFLGRYRELAAVVATREAAVREAEAKVAEQQAKVAADEQARQTLVNERQAREQEIAALTAAVAKAQEDHAALLQKVAENAVPETEAADMTARVEKLKAEIPTVTARMRELDDMITRAAAVAEASVAIMRTLEPHVVERQREVDAAVGQLSALQGIPAGK